MKLHTGSRLSVAYGGVDFELLSPTQLTLGPDHQVFAYAGPDARPVAWVRAAVEHRSRTEYSQEREVRCRWAQNHATVETRGVRAELHRLRRGHYAAHGFVEEDSAASNLLTALTGAVVAREGGVVLHAAAVVLRGKAFVFVGPSGAGKTTASNQAVGAQWLARDRAALVRSTRGWTAWGMAGGDPIDLPAAEVPFAQVAAIARVRKSSGTAQVRPLSRAAAFVALRESLQCGLGGRDDEVRALDALDELADEVPVVELWTKLGIPIPDLLLEVGAGKGPL